MEDNENQSHTLSNLGSKDKDVDCNTCHIYFLWYFKGVWINICQRFINWFM